MEPKCFPRRPHKPHELGVESLGDHTGEGGRAPFRCPFERLAGAVTDIWKFIHRRTKGHELRGTRRVRRREDGEGHGEGHGEGECELPIENG